MMEQALELLQGGKPTRVLLDGIAAEDMRILRGLNLLTSHPVLYVCNVAEGDAADGNEHTRAVEKMAEAQGARMVIISAAIEAEVAQLSDEEAQEFLSSMGLEEPGLDRLIRAGYELLHLITYFTAGPKETRAWTIERGTRAPQAAGVIHTDFERGFIRAQTIAYDDFVTLGGEVAAKEAGKARDEGKEYVVQDGDVMMFKFNT
jgi:GTP-binding protein YchF